MDRRRTGRPVGEYETTAPFIGFDTHETKVYGYGGCNRRWVCLNGRTNQTRMVMDKLASMMMACPEYEQEKALTSTCPDEKVRQETHGSDYAVIH